MKARKVRNWEDLLLAIFFCALVLLYLTGPSWGAEIEKTERSADSVLTLAECLAIAEANHPDLDGADAQKAIERGRLKQTGVADRVEVAGTVAANRTGSDGNGENASYSAGATASVKVFDANRTKYAIDAQRKTLSSTEESGQQTLLSVRTGVKTAYMDLLLDLAVRNQRNESVDAFKRHLEQARGFYEAGSKPRFDVTKAEVDLGNAELALVEAESDIEIARAALLNAMGVAESQPFEVEAVHWDIPQGTEQQAEELALLHRSDYKAAELNTLSGRATLRSEARYASPSVSLKSGYSTDGDDLFALETGWNVGLSVNIPLIDGGATKSRVEIAEGQIKALEATQEALRQNILLEVRKAVLNVKNARERIRITELTVTQAEENYELAEGRYETGVGSALEITDALLSLTDARLSAYQARYDLQTALISLEKATGMEQSLQPQLASTF